MRKISILAFMATFFAIQSDAQKKKEPTYFNNTSVSLYAGKNESGVPGKKIDLHTEGVYGFGKWALAYDINRFQPLSKKTGETLEQATMVAVGIGQNSKKFSWGTGPSLVLIPNSGSNPKTSRKFWGINGHLDVKNRSFHIATDLTFNMMTPKNQFDWARNLFFSNSEVNFYFTKNLGLRLGVGLKTYTETERMVINQPFYQNKQFVMESSLVGAGVLRFNSFNLFAGLEIKGMNHRNSYIDQQTGVLQNHKWSSDVPGAVVLGIQIILDSEKE